MKSNFLAIVIRGDLAHGTADFLDHLDRLALHSQPLFAFVRFVLGEYAGLDGIGKLGHQLLHQLRLEFFREFIRHVRLDFRLELLH